MDNSRTSTALVAKQIPSSFKNDRLTLSPAARAVASLDLSTCSEAYRCLFMSSKKDFRSYQVLSYDFQVCASEMATLFNCRDL